MRAISEKSLFVRWSAIFEQAIVVYNVYYSLADAPDDFQVTRSGRKNGVVLGDLKIYTLYVIRVSGVNSVGTEGPKSTAVIARTKEGGKISIFTSQYCFARPHTGYISSLKGECHVVFTLLLKMMKAVLLQYFVA